MRTFLPLRTLSVQQVSKPKFNQLAETTNHAVMIEQNLSSSILD
jgi:hypothetical protein